MKENGLLRVVSVVVTGAVLCCANISQAQNPPSRAVVFSEVVKLSQAHQSDDVIMGYLKNSGAAYSLSADEIIYLNNQGVSQRVIAALQAPSGAPAPAIPNSPVVPPPGAFAPPPGAIAPPPDATAPPPGAPTFNTFQSELAPDGSWVDVPGYGPCWRPNVLVSNPDWRPYYDAGHWAYTDNGWSWQSDYPWGDVVFHYGRWSMNGRYGWVWVPGYDWGPSWVAWRHADGYPGWAPLPPEARFDARLGLTFNGHVGVDLDFGLGVGMYTFVGYDHFWEHDFHHWIVPHDRVVVIFRGSHLANDFRVVNGRFFNEGFGHERVAAWTHHDVRVERIAVHDRFGDRGHEVLHDDHGRLDGHDGHDGRDGRDGRDSRGGRDGHDHP